MKNIGKSLELIPIPIERKKIEKITQNWEQNGGACIRRIKKYPKIYREGKNRMIFVACDIEHIGKIIFQGTLYDREGV